MNRIQKSIGIRNFIEFTVEVDEDGGYVAYWNDPKGGGITTQFDDIKDLPKKIMEAVHCHFEDDMPQAIKLHFVKDPILQVA